MELKECPFCNESEQLYPRLLPTTTGEPWKAIYCATCGAVGPMSKDGLEANRLWDNRPPNNTVADGFATCEACSEDFRINEDDLKYCTDCR